jgi:hypothetical protein
MGDIADSIRGTKAPAIPAVPKQYASDSFTQANNVLRLYFNQIDATNVAVRQAIASLEDRVDHTVDEIIALQALM